MRMLILLSALGCALSVRAQTVPPGDYELASTETGESRLVLTSHTIAKGETVESILISRGIQPSPRAVGMVLEANPDVRSADRIPAGTVLQTPKIEGAAGIAPGKIVSPFVVREAALTADALERSLGHSPQAKPIRDYSGALRESLQPTYGLSANAMGEWNGHSRAILDLTESGKTEDQQAALLLAKESSDELQQVRTMAKSGKSTALLVTLKGRNPPTAIFPTTCRIRYAFLGYAYSGHVVPSSHVQDPPQSNCEDGRAQLEIWIPYGIWTEWLEENKWRRSEIKRVKVLPGDSIAIDLPMQPYE